MTDRACPLAIVASGPSVARNSYPMLADQLLRSSFPSLRWSARAQLRSRPDCPWVTADDCRFPLVLARKWHGQYALRVHGAME